MQIHLGHPIYGDLQIESAGSDGLDQPPADAADKRDIGAPRDNRQIYGRLHHGVLERADGRRGTRGARLPLGAGDVPGARGSERGTPVGSGGGRR